MERKISLLGGASGATLDSLRRPRLGNSGGSRSEGQLPAGFEIPLGGHRHTQGAWRRALWDALTGTLPPGRVWRGRAQPFVFLAPALLALLLCAVSKQLTFTCALPAPAENLNLQAQRSPWAPPVEPKEGPSSLAWGGVEPPAPWCPAGQSRGLVPLGTFLLPLCQPKVTCGPVVLEGVGLQ